MNAKNLGNKAITYTAIVLNDSVFNGCMKVVRYLVSIGHKVTVLSDETLQKQREDTSMFADAIAVSDMTIIFCTNCVDGYSKDFIGMVKKIPNTYVVAVLSPNTTQAKSGVVYTGDANIPNGVIGLADIVDRFGRLRRDQVDYLLCDLALYKRS